MTPVEDQQQRALNGRCLFGFQDFFGDSLYVRLHVWVCACLRLQVCVCASRSPSCFCVCTVATPKPSQSPVWHHNGPRKSIWHFEAAKTISPHRPATLPPPAIITFSRFILRQAHDRMRNHKGPISREGTTISLGDQRANRIGRRMAKANGAAAQVGGTWQRGGGDTVTWMENAPLFLVICVTKVLIDDGRNVFPTLPWESQLSGGGFAQRSPGVEPLLYVWPLALRHTQTHIPTRFFVPCEAPDGSCPHMCIVDH